MLYELRTYRGIQGRMPELLSRFENRTIPIWKKHGIRPVGFWTTVIGEYNNHVYYMLAWESLAEREKKWNTFLVDPEWLACRAETEKNGTLIHGLSSQILEPTSFSAMK
jgi:hypothetical protein